MFAGLFDGEEFTSSHLFVVLATGLAFLAVQLALIIRIYVRMRRQERLIDGLRQNSEQGINSNHNLTSQPKNSSWLQWVTANYAGANGAANSFTRDDALHELDVQLSSDGDYLLLQRMGVMAPLLGVVLTVIGFFWLDITDEEQSLQAILLAVAPLVSGVGTGAVLALINQALLHIAGHRAESLRMAGRKWFDTTIWSQLDTNARAATGGTIAAIEQLNASIGDVSARYALGASQIHESTSAMNRAATQFHDVVQSFGASIQGMPAALSDVRRASVASAEALDELIRIGSRAVANLDVSVAAFRTTIDQEFTSAAKLQHRSGQVLAESAKQIGDATQNIRSGSDTLKQSALTNQASFERLDESLRQHVIDGNQNFREAVNGLTDRVNAFGREIASLSAIAESVSGQFNQITSGLAPSVASFRESVDHRFAAAVSQQSAHVESVNESMQKLKAAAEGMSQGSNTLNNMLREMSQFVTQTKAMHQTLTQAAANLSEVGSQLQQSMKTDVAASQQTADEVSESLAQCMQHLSDFVSKGIDPATERLAMLHNTLADFEDAIYVQDEFSEQSSDGSARTANAGNVESTSDAGSMGWLSRRPR